jgi:hypothetical protein
MAGRVAGRGLAVAPQAAAAGRAYTPPMRRLVYVVMLVGRFAGQAYVWRVAPPRRPIPIERPLELDPGAGTRVAWWLLR